jgi:plasmid stabilization system protein ParE
MAQYKIIWSIKASAQLHAILEYYVERNKSTTYSAKLYSKINQQVNLLIKHPSLGIKTELEFVRGLIIDNYIVYYKIQQDQIVIHTVWDSRRNPQTLIINK